MNRVVRIKFGSHLYGTTTPSSDVDFKSIYLPEMSDILLQDVKGSISTGPNKGYGEKNNAGDIDDEAFSLQRFLQLLGKGQTVAIDMIFAPKEMIIESTPLWDYIVENKYKLICKNTAAFLGYCRGQAGKYGAKGSRMKAAEEMWNFLDIYVHANQGQNNLETIIPSIRELVNIDQDWIEHVKFIKQEINAVGDMGWFLECCNKKASYTASIIYARDMYKRIFDGYGDRAKKAKNNDGIDWKALSHAVRVGEEALELVTIHKVTLPLPNAEYIKKIKQGLIPYQEVIERVDELLPIVEQATEESTLPEFADQDWIDNLVRDEYQHIIVREFLEKALGNN